tara:strand:+ start:1087 stop:1263 length:177 start_codon:yes stop_codon:yes gene_type:complete
MAIARQVTQDRIGSKQMCLFFYTLNGVRSANAAMARKMLQSTLQIRRTVEKSRVKTVS